MDFGEAFKLIDQIVMAKLGRSLKNHEIAILEGTWNGLTYEQIADVSEYSTNYLMRDVAPKLWKLLSEVLGKPVGKNNFQAVVNEMANTTPLTVLPIINGSQPNSDSTQLLTIKNLSVPTLQLEQEIEGYSQELNTLEQWVLKEKSRLLSIYGLSGMGKTTLAQHLIKRVSDQFDTVIWLSELLPLPQLINNLLNQKFNLSLPHHSDPISDFLEILNQSSNLIVLDAIEAVLQPGKLTGQYRPGYENYGQLLQIIGELPHRSCVVITGLENPPELLRLSTQSGLIKALHLRRLSLPDATALLAAEQLSDQKRWRDLVHCYQGNPAALRTAAQMIRELFNGNVDTFLAQQSLVFGHINSLLKRTFNRVSQLERDLLFWLTGKEDFISLANLQQEIPLVIHTTDMLEALESLIQRSLLETKQVAEGFFSICHR